MLLSHSRVLGGMLSGACWYLSTVSVVPGCGAERGGVYGFNHQEVSDAFLSEGQHPR